MSLLVFEVRNFLSQGFLCLRAGLRCQDKAVHALVPFAKFKDNADLIIRDLTLPHSVTHVRRPPAACLYSRHRHLH